MSELRLLTNIEQQLCFDKAPFTKTGEGMVSGIAVDVQMLATQGLSAIRMQAYMSRDAIEATVCSGLVTWYSRTREGLWLKGEESGNVLRVRNVNDEAGSNLAIYVDCDGDSLLIDCEPAGPTCHTGEISCFNVEAIGE